MAAGKKSHDNQQQRPISDEAILKVAKEIVVKFIEVGRLAPNNFGETFQEVYQSVRETVRSPDGSQ